MVMTATNNNGLPDWPVADGKTRRRMVMSIEGGPGEGKTDLALTAPAPIVFFELDLNSEHTLAKYAVEKKIFRLRYRVPNPLQPGSKDLAEKALSDVTRDYYTAVKSGKIRTIIWDTASGVYDLVRLALLGKIANVMPHHYMPVNAMKDAMISAAIESDTNLIMVHRMKD